MSQPSRTARNVLSIDGCGFRGLTQLLVLKRLMELYGASQSLKKTPSPCEVFDLICGTATGGLIAILIGRLGMDCDKAIEVYNQLEDAIFGKHPDLGDILRKSEFDTTEFRTALEQIVRDIAGASEKPMFLGDDEKHPSCRTVVTVVSTSTSADADAIRVRSYPAPRRLNGLPDPTPARWTIFQAAVGSASCPRLFNPLEGNEHGFMAANTSGFSNPGMIAYLEALDLFGENTPLTLISLGMGLRNFKEYKSLSKDGTNAMLNQLLKGAQLPAGQRERLELLINHTQLVATSTEIKHSRLHELIGRKFKQEYIRFDPDRGNSPYVFIDYLQIEQIHSDVHKFFSEQSASLDAAVDLLQGVASKWIQLPGHTCGSTLVRSVNNTENPTEIMRKCYRWEAVPANAGKYISCFFKPDDLTGSVELFTGEVNPVSLTVDVPEGKLYVRVLVDDKWLFFQQRVAWEGDWEDLDEDGPPMEPIDIISKVKEIKGVRAFRSDGKYTTSTQVDADKVRFYQFEFTHPYHGTWVRNERRSG